MQIADEPPTSDDLVFDHEGVKVIVDSQSHQYLEGSSIDFDDSLQGGGFKINNPNAVRSCGCGNSFASGEEEGAPQSGGGCGSGGCGCGGH